MIERERIWDEFVAVVNIKLKLNILIDWLNFLLS